MRRFDLDTGQKDSRYRTLPGMELAEQPAVRVALDLETEAKRLLQETQGSQKLVNVKEPMLRAINASMLERTIKDNAKGSSMMGLHKEVRTAIKEVKVSRRMVPVVEPLCFPQMEQYYQSALFTRTKIHSGHRAMQNMLGAKRRRNESELRRQ